MIRIYMTNYPSVDLSYVYDLSDNDNQYVCDIISIFLATIPDKILEFEKQVNELQNYKMIAEQAHALKSSSSVIKIRDMHSDLIKIESLAKTNTGIAEIQGYLSNILKNFEDAVPCLNEVLEQNKTQNG